ncbi:MAG: metallophosphoesterase, partial [Thermoprotei archaeon]
MKVLVISDLHYNKRIFRGIDESRAWSWLLDIISYHEPDLLLSCGDWGEAIDEAKFYELLRTTIILSIYGNHENMNILTKMYNIKAGIYLPVLMEDGRVYGICGLRVAGINGIIAKKRKTKKGVPRKTPEEFLEAAEKLKNKNVDVLLVHETPYLPELFPFMAKDFRSLTTLEAIRIVKPKLVVNGHMHSGCFKTHTFPWDTRYIY